VAIVRGHFARVLLNFADSRNDFLHVLLVSQKRGLGNPDGLPGRALGIGEFLLEE